MRPALEMMRGVQQLRLTPVPRVRARQLFVFCLELLQLRLDRIQEHFVRDERIDAVQGDVLKVVECVQHYDTVREVLNVSLQDEIVQVQARPKKCGLGDAIRSMDNDLAKQVLEALSNPTFESTAIAIVLKKKGYHVSRFQVGQCRKDCECGALDG